MAGLYDIIDAYGESVDYNYEIYDYQSSVDNIRNNNSGYSELDIYDAKNDVKELLSELKKEKCHRNKKNTKKCVCLPIIQLEHKKFKELSNAAKVVYVYMGFESNGKALFEFPFSKYCSLMTKPTFRKARNELVSKGFIDIEENGKLTKKPNVYKFSHRWLKQDE